MSGRVSPKDWLQISAYLDGKLGEAEKARFEARLESDVEFKGMLLELQHNQKLLRSLPTRRAPRNFTLSAQYAIAPRRRWGLHSYFGLASATAALMMIVFVGLQYFSPRASRSIQAPMAAMEMAATESPAAESAPMIITWGNDAQAYDANGLGGGAVGSAPSAKELNTGAVTAEDTQETSAETMMLDSVAAATTAPEISQSAASTPNPDELILGLPAPGTEGQEITPESVQLEMQGRGNISTFSIWMISLGGVVLVCGGLFFLLRRR